MDALTQEALDRYYKHVNKVEYLLTCQKEIVLPIELISFLHNKEIRIEKYNLGEIWPSKKWILDQGDVTKGEFSARFSSLLMVSKLAPFYYLHHEFQVMNQTEDKMSPTLDGFDNQPYTKTQAELDSVVLKGMSAKGYTRLSNSQMNEVLPDIYFNKDVELFGSQVTVEYALFHDTLELCPD